MTADREPAFRHDDTGTDEEEWFRTPLLDAADELRLDPFDRVVVVAAHPDDETLFAGGLIASAAARGRAVTVVLATAGEASHPDSPTHGREELRRIRSIEFRDAVGALAPGAEVHLAGLDDGQIASRLTDLVEAVVAALGPEAESTLLISPWAGDRHPDHEAAADACATAASRTGATHLEAPLWLWHWGHPSDLEPLTENHRLVRFAVDGPALQAKRSAMARYPSQTSPLGPEPGNEAIVGRNVTVHFDRVTEHFIRPLPRVDRPFEGLHEATPDPWNTRSAWYEERKRALTLAALPQGRYAAALELGCSVGALAHDLASRCDAVTAVDESAAALAQARAYWDSDRIEWVEASFPEEWDSIVEGRVIDLVVISEVGYFLSPPRMVELARRVSELAPRAVLACHWRHPIHGWPLNSRRVHRILDEHLGMTAGTSITDPDFDLRVWTDEAPGPVHRS